MISANPNLYEIYNMPIKIRKQGVWKHNSHKNITIKDKNYGSYCDILREEQTVSYIFHHSLGKQKEVNLFVVKNSLSCKSDSKKIKESCD